MAFSLPSLPFLLDPSPFTYAPLSYLLFPFPFTLPFSLLSSLSFFLSFSPFSFFLHFSPKPYESLYPHPWGGLTEKYTPLRKKVNLNIVFIHCKLICFKLPSSQITDVRMNHRMNIMKDCCQQETTILK